MRVIAGRAKGRRLFGPIGGVNTRPITDRAKESLFSILSTQIVDARFLDLFAGTGSVGIEALSRGAQHATFVEENGKALKTLRRNLVHTELDTDATVLKVDVFKYLLNPSDRFDVVFIAPPQYHQLWAKSLHLLDSKPEWLSSLSTVVVQIAPSEYTPPTLSNLIVCDKRCYSKVMLCFYQRIV